MLTDHAKWLSLLALICIASPPGARGDEAASGKKFEQSVAKAVNFLKKSQAEDGSFSSRAGIGVTALVTTGLLRNGRSPDEPVVAKSLAYLQKQVKPDGGIYSQGSRVRNYETCIGILCFTAANRDGKYDEIVKNADAFIKGLQIGSGDGKDQTDVTYGGVGYGGKERPDLSNTAFLVEALKASGNTAESEAMKRAMVFVSRCQNFESAHNTTPHPAKNPDGGFYYTPAAGGASQAQKLPNGGLRSYAGMTYAGLKSLIYCGVDPKDPRIQAALEWISQHYTVESNPGLGDAGLYYYYQTFAKANAAIGKNEIQDAEGKTHNWKHDLINELAQRQRPDGSWVNDNERWLEGDPNLATAHALLALSYCRPATAE